MNPELSTEQKILEAAEQVFLDEGFSGARMQQIADKAGINKAMLHYYFRSKDKLFELIFSYKMKQFMPKIEAAIQNEHLELIDKLEQFVLAYLGMLRQNPRLPVFILSTVNRNPELVKAINTPMGKMVIQLMDIEMAKGTIKKVNTQQFIISMIGMCIFPFAARPIMGGLLDIDKAEYDQILAERHIHVMQYIRAILLP